MKKARKQTVVNEVPLSPFLDDSVQTFLRTVKDDQWSYESDENGEGGRQSIALVIVLSSGDGNGVDVNVANHGLTDEMQNKMVNAALKSISGEPLFYQILAAPR
jgi:hypothetical protein